MVVELKAGIENFLHVCSILLDIFISLRLLHLELDI